jgi:plasmid stability protein
VKAPCGTRLDQGLQRRLKIYAAATDRTIEDVVTAALSGYLPPVPAEAATDSPDLARALLETNAAPAL